MLGDNSFSEYQLLLGKIDLDYWIILLLQKYFYKNKRKTRITIISHFLHHLRKEYKTLKTKRNITASSSTRYLGHYKLCIVSDGNSNDGGDEELSCNMLNALNTIMDVFIEIWCPLIILWLVVDVLIIERLANCLNINKLEIINIYEDDYNLKLNYLAVYVYLSYIER